MRATNRSYLLSRPTARPRRSFPVQHTRDEIAAELEAILQEGGTVLDTSIEHRLYGQITVDLILRDRADLAQFLARLPESSSLAELTNGFWWNEKKVVPLHPQKRRGDFQVFSPACSG